MTIPGQRANGTAPTPDDGPADSPETPPDTEWLTTPPETPGGGVAAIAVAIVGIPLAILIGFAIASGLAASSILVIRWSWDVIGRAIS